MNSSFHIDVLAQHPKAQYLESLTGYIYRLARLNGLNSYATRELILHGKSLENDNPIDALTYLALSTAKDISSLRKTTFFHLLTKFGRSIGSSFLVGSIYTCRTVCPHCLEESGFHSLLWRFRVLGGCLIHNCHLVDECSYCQKKIPLSKPGLELGLCPYCKSDLRHISTRALSIQERQNIEHNQPIIEYLLVPQPWEKDTDQVGQKMGAYLGSLRQSRELTHKEIGDRIIGRTANISLLLDVERKVPRETSLSFKRYWQLAEISGTTLMEAFEQGYQSFQEGIIYKLYTRQQSEHLELIRRVNLVISEAEKKLDEDITVAAVCERIGMVESGLRYYPEINDTLKQYAEARLIRRVQRRRQLVHKSIKLLRTLIKSSPEITINILAQCLDTTESALYQQSLADWKLRWVLEIATSLGKSKRIQLNDQRNQKIATRTRNLVAEIMASGGTPSRRVIAAKLGTTELALNKMQVTNSYLSQVLQEAKLLRRAMVTQRSEQAYAVRAREALNICLSNNQIPFQSLLADYMSINKTGLVSKAATMPTLKQVLDEANQIAKRMRSAQLAHETFIKVKLAAKQLYIQKRMKFTMRELALEVGKTCEALRMLPEVKLFMTRISDIKRSGGDLTDDDFTY